MSESKRGEIVRYLHIHFPENKIETKYDFDRDAWSFKLHFAKSTALLKVAENWIDDTDEQSIAHELDRMGVGEMLNGGGGKGVLVSDAGAREYDRR
ncbi:hypothetical protein [Methylibium sp.]|jgi:hypothetical protein|uniref:hypothetical protein n=1 Tax=Methylibium sp. TaxID=2067992 RepID=UPI003D10F064